MSRPKDWTDVIWNCIMLVTSEKKKGVYYYISKCFINQITVYSLLDSQIKVDLFEGIWFRIILRMFDLRARVWEISLLSRKSGVYATIFCLIVLFEYIRDSPGFNIDIGALTHIVWGRFGTCWPWNLSLGRPVGFLGAFTVYVDTAAEIVVLLICSCFIHVLKWHSSLTQINSSMTG